MKEINIFALPSHTYVDKVSGVDYVRVIQPMRALNGYSDGEYKINVQVYDHSKNKSFDWRDIFEEYDIIYFNYTTNDVGYAVMGTMAQKYNRKLVCDVDDDLFNIEASNPAYEAFKSGSWGRTVTKAIFGDVSHITCTNKHLKHSIEFNSAKTSDDITILPNYIDLSLYKHRTPFKDRGYYKALHFGSSTHHSDIYSPPFVGAIDRIMKEYPNFSLVTVGSNIPKFKNLWSHRYEIKFGHVDVLKWIDMMPPIMDDADFMVVPLVNNTYNRSKSSIKFLEASSYKIPGIWQRIRQYNEVVNNGDNGFLCSTEDEWYFAIKKMIDDSKLRKSMGEKAFESIQSWRMERHIKEYADTFINLLTK